MMGLTKPLIGVLLAFCAAMVGSERNELTRAMIEQTQAHSDYDAASTKFRLIMLDLERMRQMDPAHRSPRDTIVLKRFLRLEEDYNTEKKLSSAWADSYKPLIDLHFGGAESYEHAQLTAEIGIVIASIAVLLTMRPAWYLSLCLAVVCVGQLGYTGYSNHSTLSVLEAQAEQSEAAYKDLRQAHSGNHEDEDTVEELDPGSEMRKSFKASGEAKDT
jgi:hypothetical protein